MTDGSYVQVERLTYHFQRRWIQRRGVVPSIESVNLILRKGQVLKRGQDLYKSVKGRLYQYRTLTEVWIHAEAAIIWIDERRLTAVTVIVPEAEERRLCDITNHWLIDQVQGRPAGRNQGGNHAKQANH